MLAYRKTNYLSGVSIDKIGAQLEQYVFNNAKGRIAIVRALQTDTAAQQWISGLYELKNNLLKAIIDEVVSSYTRFSTTMIAGTSITTGKIPGELVGKISSNIMNRVTEKIDRSCNIDVKKYILKYLENRNY